MKIEIYSADGTLQGNAQAITVEQRMPTRDIRVGGVFMGVSVEVRVILDRVVLPCDHSPQHSVDIKMEHDGQSRWFRNCYAISYEERADFVANHLVTLSRAEYIVASDSQYVNPRVNEKTAAWLARWKRN